MTENTIIATPTGYVRTTKNKVIFWLLWGILLIPALGLLLMFGGGMLSIIMLPFVVQLIIHAVSLAWFLDEKKPFSKVMLMLLGGTGVLYFLTLGSCAILLYSLASTGFH